MLSYDSNKATCEGKGIKAASTQYALLPSRKSGLFCGKEDTMRRERAESIPRTFGRQTIITETSVPRLALRENTDAISSVQHQVGLNTEEEACFYFPRKRKNDVKSGTVRWCMCPVRHPFSCPLFPPRILRSFYIIKFLTY